MSNAPAFQLYANDFMDATSAWEANAVGLYIRCLCKQWTLGGIPDDLKVLARMIHCDRSELESVWDVLAPKFVKGEDGLLRNSKLERVRARQQEVSGKRSEAGKAGAIAKAIAKANASTKEKQRKVKEKEKVEVEGGGERASAKPDLQDRIDGFRELCLERNDGRLSQVELEKFIAYWTEHNEGARKFRAELQEVFQVERRMDTWANNAKSRTTAPADRHKATIAPRNAPIPNTLIPLKKVP